LVGLSEATFSLSNYGLIQEAYMARMGLGSEFI
jgi:hypothetical protein